MKLKNSLFLMAVSTIVIISSCDEDFDDASILSQLDSLQANNDSLFALTDSLHKLNQDALDSIGDLVDDKTVFTGPIEMTAKGELSAPSTTEFSIKRDFGILSADKTDKTYIERINANNYYVRVDLNSESVGGSSNATFSFNYDPDTEGVTNFVSSSEGVYDSPDQEEFFYFSQTGNFEGPNEKPDDIVEINGLNLNLSSLRLNIEFTVTDTLNSLQNSTSKPTDVTYKFNETLVWGERPVPE